MNFIGEKYESTKALKTTDIAKLIRADIKAAVKNGSLPAVKYSVKCHASAWSTSLTIEAIGLPSDVLNDFQGKRYSQEGQRICATLSAIVAAYNFDESDLLTDYFRNRFFADVKIGQTLP